MPILPALALMAFTMAAATPSNTVTDGYPVTGVILSAAGTPLPNARVELFAALTPEEHFALRAARRLLPDPLATCTTDPEGRYALRAPSDRLVWIAAVAPGHARMRLTRTLAIDAPRDLGPAALPAGRNLEGKVVDPRGRPVPGARVIGNDRTMNLVPRGRDLPFPLPVEAGTQNDGTFKVENLPLDKVPFGVRASGFSTSIVSITGEHPHVVIALQEGSALRGTVLAEDGKPVAGAWVVEQGGDVVQSREDGAFVLERARPDQASIRAWPAASHTGLTPSKEKEVQSKEPRAGITLTMLRGGSVTIRVVDAITRGPVPAAIVRPFDGSGTPDRHTQLDGTVILPGLRPSNVMLMSEAAGHMEETSHVRLDAGDTRAIEIALKPSASLEGTIRDAAGHPLPQATIVIGDGSPTGLILNGAHDRTRVDGSGVWRLDPVPPDRPFVAHVEHPSFAPKDVSVEPIPAGATRRLEVVLEPGIAIEGRVLAAGAEPRPVSGASVVALLEPGGPDAGRSIDLRREMYLKEGKPGDRTLPAVLTDAEGRFSIRGASPGTWTIDVAASGHAPARFAGIPIEATSPQRAGDLRLEAGGSVRGRVVASSGTLPRWWSIRSLAEGEEARWSGGPQIRREEDGSFEIADLPLGKPVRLEVEAEGFRKWLGDPIVPPVDGLVITLSPGASIRGRVVDDAGKAVRAFTIGVTEEGNRAPWSVPEHLKKFESDDGSFRMGGLPAGRLSVTARADGYREARVDGLEMIGETESEEILLTLRPSLTIAGMVTDEQGRPVAEARVSVAREMMNFSDLASLMKDYDTVESDAGGLFVMSIPSPMKLRLEASHEDYRKGTVDVDAGGPVEGVKIVLTLGGTLRGRVVRADGTPIAGAAVRASQQDEGEDPARVESASDGSFSFKGLAAGSWRVQAFREGVGTAAIDGVQVPASGEAAPCELRLGGGARLAGRVVVAPGRDPSGIPIRFGSRSGHQASGATDAEGRFEMRGLPPGEAQVVAGAPDQRIASEVLTIPDSEETIEVTLTLESGNTVDGTVTRSGAPVSGAIVMIGGQGGMITAHTDSAGRYMAKDVPSGEAHMVVMEERLGVLHTAKLEIEGDRRYDIALEDLQVRGRVVASTGEPLEGVTLSAARLGDDASIADSLLGGLSGVTTTQSGTYVIHGLGSHDYEVTARRSGYADAKRPITLKGSDGELDFTMQAATPLGMRVLDGRNGSAVGTFMAMAMAPGDRFPSFMGQLAPDENKISHIESLPAGHYQIWLMAEDLAYEKLDVEVPAPGLISVAMSPGGTLELQGKKGSTARSVKLFDARGELCWPDLADVAAGVPLQDDKPVTIPSLKQGSYVLRFLPAGSIPDRSVTITAGQVTKLEIP